MPITQDRLISLVARADVLLDAVDELRALAKATPLQDALANGNSALAHVTDAPTRETIRRLMQVIEATANHIAEVTDIPQALRDNIAEERIHFKKHRKANEYLARYHRYKRHAKRELDASEAAMPHVFADLPPAATQAWTQTSDIMADYNSPEAMAARFAGYAAEEKAERAAHLAKLNEEGAAEREELRQRPRIMIPPGEEMTIEEANAFVARKRNGNIKAPADPTDNNDPANVIRHLPTPEELLEHNPAPTGKDVL